MSRHMFDTQYQGRPIQVVLGWDRPLQGFFMAIEWTDLDPEKAADDEPLFLFDNLDERVSHPPTLDAYRRKLAELGIEVPSSMFEAAEADQRLDIGKRDVVHLSDGRVQEMLGLDLL